MLVDALSRLKWLAVAGEEVSSEKGIEAIVLLQNVLRVESIESTLRKERWIATPVAGLCGLP